MKRLIVIAVILLAMCGCAKETSFETVSDELQITQEVQGQIQMTLPEGVDISTILEDTGGKLYICDNYTISEYTVQSGDLKETIQTATGFDLDEIHIISTQQDGIQRYDCTWTSAGEGELQTCRAAILDDGSYHYVVSTMGDSSSVSDFADEWQSIFQSFSIIDTEQ